MAMPRAQQVLPRAEPAAIGLAPDALAEATRLLERFVADGKIAGAVAAIARDGKVGYLTAVGVQDLESRSPMTPRSLFRIYSMAKAVTAVAVMQLHDDGRFRLDDPVSKYLPEFAEVRVVERPGATPRPPLRAITVEDLLLRRGCVVQKGRQLRPTYAGLLLFGRQPQRWVRGAEVLCARFKSDEMDDAFARQTIAGTLPEQIRRAELFLIENAQTASRIRAWQREDMAPYPAGVLREVLQQLEFLVGQVQRAATQPRGVGPLVDHQFAQGDLARTLLGGRAGLAAGQQSQSGVQFGRADTRQQDLVEPPFHVHRHQSALGEHGHHRNRPAGGSQQPAQRARCRQVGAGIDDRHVRITRLQQRRHLRRRRTHGMRQQRQRRQDRVWLRVRGE